MLGNRFFYDSHPPEVALELLLSLGPEAMIAEFMTLPTDGRDKGRFAIVSEKRAATRSDTLPAPRGNQELARLRSSSRVGSRS